MFRFSKGYANEEAEKRKTRRTALEKKVCDLEKQVVETKGNSESIVPEYENAKIELEKIYGYITDGNNTQIKMCMKKGRKIPNIFCLKRKATKPNHISGN